MKEIYVCSDVHGQYKAFMKGIKELFHPGDKLYYLGDAIDRGPDAYNVLDFLLSQNDEIDITMLCGNHEKMFLEFLHEVEQYVMPRQLDSLSLDEFWYIVELLENKHYWTMVNGGEKTILDLKNKIRTMEELIDIKKKLNNLPYDTSIKVNDISYYMVHGSPQENNDEAMLWEGASIEKNYQTFGDYIIFGHRMTCRYQDKDPMEVYYGPNNIIGIDTGSGAPFLGGRVCFFRLRDHKAFYYDIY